MTSNPLQPMSNGTPEYRRTRGILYNNTKVGNSMLPIARSGLDAGRFKGMQVRDRRHPVVDSETGPVMRLVYFDDPMGPLSKASLPTRALVGVSFVSEIFAALEGKIAEIHAFWIPSEEIVKTPSASGSVLVRDW